MNIIKQQLVNGILLERIDTIVKNVASQAKHMGKTVVKNKGFGNFVSHVDLYIEKMLKENLKREYPQIGFISEESDAEIKDYNWIIDPIDGTTNFLFGYPCTISIGLSDANTNDIIFAFIFELMEDSIFYALKGNGSYWIKNGNKKKLSVNKYNRNEGISLFGMPYDRNKTKKMLDIAYRLYNISADIKRIGPASLDICKVASGYAKIYAEVDLKIWDYAAGLLILEEAGGKFEKIGDILVFMADCNETEKRKLLSQLLTAGVTSSHT